MMLEKEPVYHSVLMNGIIPEMYLIHILSVLPE